MARFSFMLIYRSEVYKNRSHYRLCLGSVAFSHYFDGTQLSDVFSDWSFYDDCLVYPFESIVFIHYYQS